MSGSVRIASSRSSAAACPALHSRSACGPASTSAHARGQHQCQQRRRATVAHAERYEEGVKLNQEFGYSRKDVILIGAGLIGFGVLLNKGLQLFGVDEFQAGNISQLIIFIGICGGWVGSYVFRVANKDMTYVKQLEEYEEAVMQKRLDEMPEDELQRILDESDQQRARIKERQSQKESQKQGS